MDEMSKLEEAKKIMEQFKRQTEQNSSHLRVGSNVFDNQGGDFAEYGNGNSIGMGFDNQGVDDKPIIFQNNVSHPVNGPFPNNTSPTPTPPRIMESTPPQPSTYAAAPSTILSAGQCPQCKQIHPPLRHGESCPNVGVASKIKDSGIDDTEINKFLVQLRDIMISQMSLKKVKNGKKFFQHAVVELTKSLEKYSE